MVKQKYKTLQIEDGFYKTTLNTMFLNRTKYVKEDVTELKALIPGIVKKINVKKNQQVKEGDNLFVLDAMKMENIIKSHMNGTIKSINVKIGEQVIKGQITIKFQK